MFRVYTAAMITKNDINHTKHNISKYNVKKIYKRKGHFLRIGIMFPDASSSLPVNHQMRESGSKRLY